MNFSNSLNRLCRLTPALVLVAAGSALACDKRVEDVAAQHAACDPAIAEAHHGGEFALVRAAGQESQSEHSWSDGKNEIRISRKNGKVVVRLNGEEVMNIDDEDLFQAEIGDARQRELARTIRDRVRQGLAPLAPEAPVPPGVAWAFGQSPKVMIGVTMETAAEAGTDVPAGVDAEDATVMTRVVEGLPADKAGLKEGDLVLKINGNAPASPGDIRDAIRDLNPGDTLSFRVRREGAEQDISITLDKYDPEKLGSRRWYGSWSDDETAPEALSEEDIKRLDELRAKMEQTSGKLADVGRHMARAKDKAERERLGLEMEELGSVMAELGSEMGELSGHEFGWRGLLPGARGHTFGDFPKVMIERGPGPRAFVVPAPEAQGGPAEEDRIGKLEQKIDKIEKLLEKLAEKEGNR
jgi:hypothetical protein